MDVTAREFEDLNAIREGLDAGGAVIRSLAGGGQLHIERPQPFLCLYRRPAEGTDAGTRELLTTQVSWLAVAAEEPGPAALKEMLEVILQALAARFGGVLLIETWSAEPGEPHAETGAMPVRITLHAGDQDPPGDTLEELDRALLALQWSVGDRPEIDISYDRADAPPGMSPVLSERRLAQIGITSIGLEITPFYQDHESGELLPKVHAEVRKNLGIALKRAFYTFIDEHSNYQPAHYHELGPGRLEDIDLEVDAELARIDDAVDLLLNVTPVNVPQAWQRFQRRKCQEIPEFHYRALRVDPATLKRELFATPVDAVADPALFHLFADKRSELDRQISMLDDRDSKNFLLESQQIYGRADTDTLAIAKTILERVPPHTHDDHVSDSIDAETFAHHAVEEVNWYRERDEGLSSQVKVRTDIPGLLVSHGNFLIGESAKVARHRIEATLQHEIGTHVVTWHNGGSQPLKLLQAGLAGYEELQEGLAVLSEYLVGGLSRPRLRQIAGRVVAVDQLAGGATFLDVFRSLCDHYEFSQKAAFMLAMRVFRGGGFTKDVVYLRGLIDVLEYLQAGENIDHLYVGKIGLQHVEIVDELLWRQIFQPPRLMPRYLQSEIAATRLAELQRSGTSAINLVMESLQ